MLKNFAIASIATAALAGCGGGGSGNTSGNDATNTITVSGSAAKGLLSGALVRAYIYDANGNRTPVGQEVRTDSNGNYTLNLPPSNVPVVIEIKSTTGTKMLDETVVENGSFKVIDAPTNLVIRTGVSSLTENTTAHANPYTEAAVNAALTATDSNNAKAPLTASIFIAAKGAIRESLGGSNPFMIRGINANHDNINDEERKFTTLLAGIAKKGAETSCTGDSSGITCAISNLNDASRIKVDNLNRITFSDPNKQHNEFQNIVIKAKEVNNSFVNVTKNSLPNAVKVINAVDPVVVTSRDDLQSFIISMRNGFKATQTSLKTASDDFKERTKNWHPVGEFTSLEEVSNAISGCTANANTETYICSNTSGNLTITYSGNNGNYQYQYTKPGYYNPLNERYVSYPTGLAQIGTIKTSGTIVASINKSIGTVNLKITSTKELIRSNPAITKKISETYYAADVGLGTDLNLSNCIECSIKISVVSKIYDYENQNQYAMLSLDNWSGKATVDRNIVTNANLSGGITISTSDGDSVSGTANAEARTPVMTSTTSPQARPTSVNLQISGKIGKSDIVKGNININFDYSSVNPKSPIGTYCTTIYENVAGNLPGFKTTCEYNNPLTNTIADLTFIGGTGITFKALQTDQTKISQSLKISTAGNFITISNQQEMFNGQWRNAIGSKTLISSSSGDFSSESDLSNGTFTGPLKKGSTTIGQITNNVIYVNGQEVSLY